MNNEVERILGKLREDEANITNDFYTQLNAINMIGPHEGKQAIKVELGNKPITIVPISDIHIGSKMCNITKLEAIIKLIDVTPDCYTVLLGDLGEIATRTSVGLGVYEENFHIPEQLAVLHHLLKPLAEKGKILGVVTGNHEMRVSYTVKLNPAQMLAEKLDVPYLGYQGYLLLKVGDLSYSVMLHHGSGGGTTPAGKLNAMRKLAKVSECDIYMSGHTHGKMYDNDVIFYIDEEECMLVPKTKHYIVCGSYLEYWGGYAEMNLLQPTTTGAVAIVLSPTIKDVSIRL